MKLEAAYETEIYISVGGLAGIKQIKENRKEERVVFNSSQARIVAKELLKIADEVERIEKGQQRAILKNT